MNPIIIHLCAPNDRNGNPRRLFAIYHAPTSDSGYSGIIEYVDEGYAGFGAILGLERNVRDSIDIPASEYRRLLKGKR